jgi:hypothetical protein
VVETEVLLGGGKLTAMTRWQPKTVETLGAGHETINQ